jgi:hypothetical protein
VGRVLALLGAVAMVVGALALSGRLPGGGEDGDGAAAGDRPPAAVLRLHCASEVVAACRLLAEGDERIDVEEGRPGETADALLDGTGVDADVWLAPAPWVEVVRVLGGERGPLAEPTGVLARSPLVVAAFAGGLGPCEGEPVVWRCIGDQAAALRPGIEPLDRTEGLFSVASAGSAFFGRSAYATNDLDAPPEDGGPAFADWAASLLVAVPRATTGTPLRSMLVTRTATYDLAASVEAVAGPAIAASRERDAMRLLYPEPMATVDVVAVPVTGGEQGAARELVELLDGSGGAAALAETGWRVGGEPPVAGVDPAVVLPEDDGLPPAGVLAALRDRLS